jgi:hypothetical protein
VRRRVKTLALQGGKRQKKDGEAPSKPVFHERQLGGKTPSADLVPSSQRDSRSPSPGQRPGERVNHRFVSAQRANHSPGFRGEPLVRWTEETRVRGPFPQGVALGWENGCSFGARNNTRTKPFLASQRISSRSGGNRLTADANPWPWRNPTFRFRPYALLNDNPASRKFCTICLHPPVVRSIIVCRNYALLVRGSLNRESRSC